MLDIFLVLVVLIATLGLCLHHHTMKKKLNHSIGQDIGLVRAAAEHSIMASNTVNPILALCEVTRAVQIMEDLHGRYGPDLASDLTSVDTREVLQVLLAQKKLIIADIYSLNPNMAPEHPLSQLAGYRLEE
jgi:hypothetical protein